MHVIKRVVKPKTHRGKKAIIKREPQLIEDAKHILCIRGSTASRTVNDCMKDLYSLKKPDAQLMQKKNPIRPFEDATPVEQFCRKLNSPLFMFVSHNKKRPHNLIMGRTFEQSLLDMAEFGIENFRSLKDFKGDKIADGIKPALVFNGELWENNREYGRMRNLLVDVFQRDVARNVRLQGLEHVLSFTAIDDKILLRSYRISFKKSGSRIPRVELAEIGPRVDLKVRRTQLASDDLFKQSCKKPKELRAKTKKNVSKDKLGSTYGRIHMGAQNINGIQTRKMKGLKKTLAERKIERKRRILEEGRVGAKKAKSV